MTEPTQDQTPQPAGPASLQEALARFASYRDFFEGASKQTKKAKHKDPLARDFHHPALLALFDVASILTHWSQIVEQKITELEADLEYDDDLPMEETGAPVGALQVHGRLVDGSGIVLDSNELDKLMSFFKGLSEHEALQAPTAQNQEIQNTIRGFMMLLMAKAEGQPLAAYAERLKAEAAKQQQQG